MPNDVVELLRRHKTIESNRRQWDTHFQELAEYMLPRRADFTGPRNPGQKRTERQFDGVPMQAARGLASAVDALIKPKTEKWFTASTGDEELDENPEIKEWMEEATDITYDELYASESRFLQRSAEVDNDLVVFGTGVLFIGGRPATGGLLFQSAPLASTWIAENADGDIDTVFRRQIFTARQAEQRFGRDNLGTKTREALTNNKADTEFPFLQIVLPRDERNAAKRNNVNMPFASIVIDVESEHKIGESGFHEFPFAVPRWDTASGEVYGRSPAMLALPDVKTVNQQAKTILRAGHMITDPPLLTPSGSGFSSLRNWPGGITPYDPSILSKTGGKSPVFPLVTGGNIPIGREMQNDTRDQIWAAFFRDVLQLPPSDGTKMTATEILERKAQLIRSVGPTFGRLEADYPAVIVERSFAILQRAGKFPEPPELLEGENIKFKFVSPIARALRQVEAASLGKTIADIEPLVALNPALMDNFEDDQISRDVGEANGMPQKWLRSIDDRDAIRQQRAEAQAAEQQKADLERLAAAAPNVTGALKDVAGVVQGAE